MPDDLRALTEGIKNNLNKVRASKSFGMEYGKVQPQAADMEETILGTVMRDKDAIYDVVDLLVEESFYVDAHQKIWGAVKRLYDKKTPIDSLTVMESLKSVGHLEMVGGFYYITELTNNLASTSNLKAHAAIIVQKQMRREMIRISSELAREAYDDTVDVFDLKERMEQAELNINSHIESSKTVTMDKAFIDFMEDLNSSDGDIRGLRTGFKKLDKVFLGIDEGDFVILAARPGMGKTAAALQIADYMAKELELYVPFVTIEMTPKQLFQRRVARIAQIPLGSLKKSSDLTSAEWQRIVGFTGSLSVSGLEFEDCASLNILQFKSMARKFVKEKGAQIIFVDYIQLMKVSGLTDPVQVVTEISQQMKAICKELNIRIIALSQLSRPPKGQAVKPPTLTDLRGSGSLEQDCDKSLMLHRFDYYDPEDRPGLCEWIINKNRSGGLDVLEFSFNGPTLTFKEDDFSLPEIDENAAHFENVRDIGEAGQKDFEFDE